MAAPLAKFSFSGWNSQSLAPKVNPATVPVKTLQQDALRNASGQLEELIKTGKGDSPLAKSLWAGIQTGNAALTAGGTGTLVGTTNAANPDLPAWLQAEMDRLNAQEALRKAALGGGGGGGAVTGPPAFDPNLGVAAVTNARANFNAQMNQVNEQARLQLLQQQRDQLRPQGFGFNNPFDVNRILGLDRQIENYQRVNLPLAASAVGGRRNASGWLASPWS